ncbi:rhomboid family protein [Flaviaesturariibacter flavus]|uniref:Rhomboid family protein n=1 Tax=Flaviaesturariibacter flavus TaxID=2502780 RepID=A0A4R1B8W0_9BACT|nr:DUF6576 domain-containing protein [Flaviaesturariibacter flavus]TCJ13365.1 rhomboid family protein [Flaviaesturariibacter flavus]
MFPGILGLVAIGLLLYFFARKAQRTHVLGDTQSGLTIDEKYNLERRDRQETVDRLLDKIARKGYGSLSEKEKQLLKEHSSMLN